MSSKEWKAYKLGNLLKKKGYIRGPFGSSLKRGEMKSKGIPVYEQQHAIYNTRDFRFYIDKNKFNELKRFQVKVNDLIVSCSGTIGKVSIITEDDPKGIISQALLILRADNTIVIPQYLKYYFSTREGFNNLVSASHGSVQINIARRDVVEAMEINVPSVEKQCRIVSILSALDDKIELNHQTNQTLETIARGIYKEWFINFNFPGATGEMQDSVLGPIPKGWRVGKLGDNVDTVLGGTPSTANKSFWENGTIGWINSGKINEIRITEPTAYITKEAVEKSSTKLLPKGTVVIAITGATLGQVSLLEIDSCANQSVVGVLENDEWPFEFLYLWIKNQIGEIIKNQSGGAQQHINKNDVNNSLLLIPRLNIVKDFAITTGGFFRYISKNCFEISNLAQIRDTLLPKLMSGEIEA